MNAGPRPYCDYLERIHPDNLGELMSLISQDVHFKDPFNDVRGAGAMYAIFADMFEHVRDLKFRIHERFEKDAVTVIHWTMSGEVMGEAWSVEGMSRLSFDAHGLLAEHVDYWDAASGLYERFPVIGWMLRRIRQKLAVPPPERAA